MLVQPVLTLLCYRSCNLLVDGSNDSRLWPQPNSRGHTQTRHTACQFATATRAYVLTAAKCQLHHNQGSSTMRSADVVLLRLTAIIPPNAPCHATYLAKRTLPATWDGTQFEYIYQTWQKPPPPM
ncbi:hypothetical protein BST61_g4643 [Cercospora zeina]